MTVTGVRKDPAARTMTITSEFAAPIDRVWQLWADPRQLERWWGPPTHPATVVDHDLSPGGKVSYFVTGPEGDRMTGWWDVRTVEGRRPRRADLGLVVAFIARMRLLWPTTTPRSRDWPWVGTEVDVGHESGIRL